MSQRRSPYMGRVASMLIIDRAIEDDGLRLRLRPSYGSIHDCCRGANTNTGDSYRVREPEP